jgi:hypothetical protein
LQDVKISPVASNKKSDMCEQDHGIALDVELQQLEINPEFSDFAHPNHRDNR